MAPAYMALGSDGSLAAPTDRYDADRLLTGYRAARAQEALFDLRSASAAGPGIGFDEFVDQNGNVRPAWTELADAVAERGRFGLNRLRSMVHSLIDNDGITYTEVDAVREGPAGPSKLQGLEPRPW